ncbi:MAG: PEP-CTERM sorting domain-containing protein [Sphingomonadales bacterium]|jgi:hypothetical protein
MSVRSTRPQRSSRHRLLSFLPYVLALGLAGLTQPAEASVKTTPVTVKTTHTATAATLQSVLKQLRPGDTLALSGTFAETQIRDRDFGGVLIDARAASFAGGLVLRNVHNVTFHGGTYGSALQNLRNNQTIDVFDSSHISFRHAKVIGNADGNGTGLLFRRSSFVTVRDSNFTGHRAALGLTTTTDSLLMRNKFSNMSSDGINIADSHRVVASFNQCSSFVPSPGAHPDCIQLWSVAGNARQSDLALLNNTAWGDMQGFTSFNASAGGAERILMAGNLAAITFPQGIACYTCFDSQFLDNTLVALPGARWRASLNLVGGGNNQLAGNTMLDYRAGTPAQQAMLATLAGGSVLEQARMMSMQLAAAKDRAMPGFSVGGSRWDNRAFQVSALPEPETWAQLIMGLGLIGVLHRRRERMQVRTC